MMKQLESDEGKSTADQEDACILSPVVDTPPAPRWDGRWEDTEFLV